MTRNSSRISLYCIFYWNAIINAQTTAKIILPPWSPVPIMTECSCSTACIDSSCRPQSVQRRAALSINATASPTSATATLTSNTLTMSTSTATSDPDSDDSMHTSVPVVAGSLAGLIAILAAVLTVVVIQRKKRLTDSRAMASHPPYLGRNRTAVFASDIQSPISPSSAATTANPFITPISTRPPSQKRGSRYEYVADNLELTQRDGDAKYVPRIGHNEPEDDLERGVRPATALENDRRQFTPPQQSRRDAHNPEVPSPTLRTGTFQTRDREGLEKAQSPPTIANYVPNFPPSALVEAVGRPATHPASSSSNGHRPLLGTSVVSGPPPLNDWVPRKGGDQRGDLPPAYEDVR